MIDYPIPLPPVKRNGANASFRAFIRGVPSLPPWAWAASYVRLGMVVVHDPARISADGRTLSNTYELKTLDRLCPDTVAAVGCGGWREDGKLDYVHFDFDVGHGNATDAYATAEDAVAAAVELRRFVGGAADVRRSKSGAGIHIRVALTPGIKDGRRHAPCIARWLKSRMGIHCDSAALGRQCLWWWVAEPGAHSFEAILPCEGAWTPPSEALQPPLVVAPPQTVRRGPAWRFSALAEPTPVDLARRYVDRMPEAISGQGGHATTFRVACVLVHGFALTIDEAWALLLEYNARCVPPWSERELRHKIASAVSNTNHRRPRGHLFDEALRRWHERQFRRGAVRTYSLVTPSVRRAQEVRRG